MAHQVYDLGLSVKPDFVVLRDRQRPEFVAPVTADRVNALANDLATNEVKAHERLIALGPAAVPGQCDK